jgi:hypothetical protein
MLNLVLFLVGASLFFAMWRGWFYGQKPWRLRGYAWRIAFSAFLFAPFNVNGDVYTIFGSGKSEGSFYSIASLYPLSHLSSSKPAQEVHGLAQD